MRDRLRAIDGERQTFIAEFVRFGVKQGYKGKEETVLLKKIHDSSGNFITDHLWFNLTAGFEKLNLKEGERIQFDARVRSYTKGYKGRLAKILNPSKSIEKKDFKLSHPTRILKLTS
ncbi:MAG TPA: hypothetical protein VHO03_20125 [Ignavibacteriales bacterium]|nr:hypothetical protein [Ignavibacteriales bacterium]